MEMDDFDDFIYAIDGKSFLDFLVFRKPPKYILPAQRKLSNQHLKRILNGKEFIFIIKILFNQSVNVHYIEIKNLFN